MLSAKMFRRRFEAIKRGPFTLSLAILLLVVSSSPLAPRPTGSGLAEAAPPDHTSEEGQVIFQEKCTPCHTIGGGSLVGPDLKEVTTQRERDWLVRWISAPDEVLAEGDPIATQLLQEFNNVPMPNQGLTEDEVAALIAYLESQAEAEATLPSTQEAPVPALPKGDPALGKNMFMGVVSFQNGAPPCMACHSIAGIGALGGGALGPDLTPAYSRFGEAGIVSVLSDIPFPTMKPIFDNRNLTSEEQEHLKAFLQQAAAEQPTQAIAILVLLAVAGAAILLALTHLLWRRRLTAVRQPLVRQVT